MKRQASHIAIALAFGVAPLIMFSADASAQAIRSFSERFKTNDNGSIRMIGNTIVSCNPTLSPDCDDVRDGFDPLGTAGLNNNDHLMVYVDADNITDTFNSTAATATLPPNVEVLFAGLYWGGETGGFTASGVAAPSPSLKDRVKLATPATAGYVDIVANAADCDTTLIGSEFGEYYSCFADITAQVPMTGSGQYIVGNIQTSQGPNSHGGWGIIFVYRDLNEPLRNLTVFDGFAAVTLADATSSLVTLPVSGFTTPFTGTVSTDIGLLAYEGDRTANNARIALDGTFLGDALNPANNAFNSTISTFGQAPTTSIPAWNNQMGFDADLISADGLLGNNVSSTTITLETDGDFYYPAVVTFATELYAPELVFTMEAIDLNGGELEPGDVLQYNITAQNIGTAPADGLKVNNAIPAGTTFVPGSLTVEGVSQSDSSGDDLATFNSANDLITFHLGSGATASMGGSLLQNQTSSASFQVKINDTASSGQTIQNQAVADFTGRTLGQGVSKLSDDATTPGSGMTSVQVDMVPPAIDITTPAPNSVVAERRPEITGQTEPGATVTISIDGGANATVTADSNGDWSYTPTSDLADGAHSVIATARDKAGNESTDMTTFAVDLTAPALSIGAPRDGSVINETRPEITGMSDPGSDVEVLIDGVKVADVTADANGDWSYTPTSDLSMGSHTVTARTADNVGNTAETESTFEVDTVAPAVDIDSPGPGQGTNDQQPTISGTAEPGSTVELVIDGSDPILVTVNPDGTWSYTPGSQLGEGSHSVTVTATDEAGNSATDSTTFDIDVTAPDVAIDAPASGSTTEDTTPTISGTSEPGQEVEIFIDGMKVADVTADGSGAWSYTPDQELGAGPHTATARVQDDLGNTADANTSFEIDPPAPAMVDITSPADGATIEMNTPTISGTTLPGSTVQITVDGGEPVSVVADADGNWSYTPSAPLDNGEHTVTAKVDDAEDSVTFTVDVDIEPPALDITSPEQSSQTTDTTPEITGKADPGATVTVIIDDSEPVTVTADANGDWSYTPAQELEVGIHTVIAQVTDDQDQTANDSVQFEVIEEGGMGMIEEPNNSSNNGMGENNNPGDDDDDIIIIPTEEAEWQLQGNGGCQTTDANPASGLAGLLLALGALFTRRRRD